MLMLTEDAVRRFPRYHKYTLGSDLRRQALWVCRLVNRAWRDQRRRERHLEHLVMAVDELKLLIQLGKELKAFASFGQFEEVSRVAVALGKQSGGWRRQFSGRPESGPLEGRACADITVRRRPLAEAGESDAERPTRRRLGARWAARGRRQARRR